MLPAIVSQLVVLLKDTALGLHHQLPELLYVGKQIGGRLPFGFPYVPAYLVVAVIYIGTCGLLSWFAFWLQKRLSGGPKQVKTTAKPVKLADVGQSRVSGPERSGGPRIMGTAQAHGVAARSEAMLRADRTMIGKVAQSTYAARVADTGFRLGIDFGTSNTVAVLRWPDGRTKPLLFDGSPLLPSAVYVNADGTILTGVTPCIRPACSRTGSSRTRSAGSKRAPSGSASRTCRSSTSSRRCCAGRRRVLPGRGRPPERGNAHPPGDVAAAAPPDACAGRHGRRVPGPVPVLRAGRRGLLLRRHHRHPRPRRRHRRGV